MRSAEKFMRDTQAAAVRVVERASLMGEPSMSHDELSKVDDAVKVLGDAINVIADREKQAKARRERIVWIQAQGGLLVAKVGTGYAHYLHSRRVAYLYGPGTTDAALARFEVTSTEGAARAIRAWRKKK